MTADLINLRATRKAKLRTEKQRRAAENRAKFGRSKAEREKLSIQQRIDAVRLDGARCGAPASDQERFRKSVKRFSEKKRDKTKDEHDD